MTLKANGPLVGLKVIEFAGIGPGPFACMMLSDMGADVVSIERPPLKEKGANHVIGRGRSQLAANLKDPADRRRVLELVESADAIIEGFRPGVMERLGLGPDDLLALNPRLVYGRMTGWGQSGPLAQAAGHDINYISVTGALHAIGTHSGPPVVPLNLLGDYGGGSLYLVVGILAALLEARASGNGQVVDAAIVDGVVNMMANTAARALRGAFTEKRGTNMLDGGHPYYRVYETFDGQYVSLGAIEPQFFAEFCERVGVPAHLRDKQLDENYWTELTEALEAVFRAATREHWRAQLEGTDACVAPVISLSEAALHPHNLARENFVTIAGVQQPGPAPKFSRTSAAVQGISVVATIDDVVNRWREPK